MRHICAGCILSYARIILMIFDNCTRKNEGNNDIKYVRRERKLSIASYRKGKWYCTYVHMICTLRNIVHGSSWGIYVSVGMSLFWFQHKAAGIYSPVNPPPPPAHERSYKRITCIHTYGESREVQEILKTPRDGEILSTFITKLFTYN